MDAATEQQVIFTTGQVARLCHVAPRTAANWFDRGLLKGYRLPGTKDRRVTRSSLVLFLSQHGMPTLPDLESGKL